MPTEYQQFFETKLFRFLVGPEETSITIHSGFVKSTSPKLAELFRDTTENTRQQVVTLDDVDRDTFLRFCEYAYRGSYTAADPEFPAPEPVEEPAVEAITNGHHYESHEIHTFEEEQLYPPEESPVQPPQEDTWYDEMLRAKSKKSKKKKKSTYTEPLPEPEPEVAEEIPRAYFSSLNTDDSTELPESKAENICFSFVQRVYKPQNLDFQALENDSVGGDFTAVFESHARIYSFAQTYEISDLAELSLYNLHRQLVAFKIWTERLGDIVNLARYVFDKNNTADSSPEEPLDRLRDLVLEYLVCINTELKENKEYLALQEANGQLARCIYVNISRLFL